MLKPAAAKLLLALAAVLVLPLLAAAQAPDNKSEAGRSFRSYLEGDWKRWMHEYPESATEFGFPGENNRWTDYTPAGFAAHDAHLRDSLAMLDKIDRATLPAPEQLNYDLYHELLSTSVEGLQYGDDPFPFRGVVPFNRWMPLTQMNNPLGDAADILASSPTAKVSDYEDILARLDALPVVVEQTSALMQEGLRRGYTPPKIALRDVPKQILDLIPDDPMKSALFQPFNEFPMAVAQSDRDALFARAKTIYAAKIVPAYRKFREYLIATYIPGCRENIAATALPDGAAAYAFHIRWHTTTTMTAAQIHEIGLSEVKRIRVEMDRIIQSVNFKGSFHDFTEFLRTAPRFFYDKPEDLVNGYRIIVKQIDPELAHEFGKLPRLTYGVTPVPDFKAPSQTTGYYEPGAPAVGRPGIFFANTYNLHARPKWEMEALSLHESVPGHHLQIALAQELEDVPEFRKNIGYSAFDEGWGLYAESLGEELGRYKDPYSKFGQLTYEMWRAVRLVVDTGMHSMGWTRQQALDYFRDNTGKSDQDMTAEVDRYIVWPGQALAYKIGQLKIRELRSTAEKKLSTNFDVRSFHDAVLEQGSLPLTVLEAHMNAWTAAKVAGH
jgi:uncharacterized protein (DUF885 family)